MLNKTIIICLMILGFFTSAFAEDVQWNGTTSQLWDLADNWDLLRVPVIDDTVFIFVSPGPVIDTNTNAAVNALEIADSVLDVEGGNLTVGPYDGLYLGLDLGTTGGLTLNGGSIIVNFNSYIGYEGSGIVNIYDGNLIVNGALGIAYNSDLSVGQVNLYGGTLSCTDLIMAPWDGVASIDITEGTLIIDGNKISTVNSYVNICGWITAYGGSGTVVFDYNITNPGKTTLSVSKGAKNPDPVNNKLNVPMTQIMHWTSVPGATHDLYFGTDFNEVNSATHATDSLAGDLDGDGIVDYNDLARLTSYWLLDPTGSIPFAGVNSDNIVDFIDYALLANNWLAQAGSNPLFMGNLDTNSFDPNLASNTTYYWRVDEIADGKVWKGNVWNFTTMDTNYSLIGKVMCGYQGWFNCTGDGANKGWFHWQRSGSNAPTPTNVHVDLWPEMNEMNSAEMFAPSSLFNDGNGVHYLFSSHNRDTVLRHFKWMQDYGIDGVYLQRFATEIKNQGSASFLNRNDILDYCKDGANMYGRKYAVMYDLSNLGNGETSYVINDWKYLVDTKHLILDPNYLHHRGKPVVAVWGIGFNDGRNYTLAECLTLVDFLRNDPVYGGNIVMVGMPSYWRQHDGSHDCLNDPCVGTIAQVADIVSPWAVGRYARTSEVATYASDVWNQDVLWCQQHSTPSHPIDYLPVIFPGYSYHNATANQSQPQPINQIPRNGGQFFWDQVYYTTGAGVNMLYIAMFDEVDEGTAIFKVTNAPPTGAPFISYRQELRGQGSGYLPMGAPLANDEYLWLTGQSGMAIRNEIPRTSIRPARP